MPVSYTHLDVYKRQVIPLSGGFEMPIDPGIFRPRNITPDLETGIGKLSDGEVARVMRHSVGADGRVIVPFMPFQNMSNDDLTAVKMCIRDSAYTTPILVISVGLGICNRSINFGLPDTRSNRNTWDANTDPVNDWMTRRYPTNKYPFFANSRLVIVLSVKASDNEVAPKAVPVFSS